MTFAVALFTVVFAADAFALSLALSGIRTELRLIRESLEKVSL